MRPRPVLILFLKAPVVGAVKTRLAADIGPVDAWRFYCSTAEKVGAALAGHHGWRTVLAISPDDSRRHIARCLPRLHGLPVIAQGRGDIGVRMQRCLDAFAPAPRILIGADIPGVTAEIIDRSFHKLKNAEIAYGPAEDGGFWLIGQRGFAGPLEPFANVVWSSNKTLIQARRNIPAHLRVAECPVLMDIDDGAALAAWNRGAAKTAPL